MINYKYEFGLWGEKVAVRYFRANDCYIIFHRWHCVEGEIDLIAWDNKAKSLVFIEVKTRSNNNFSEALESINIIKRKKLMRAVEQFISNNNYQGEYRFDVIVVIKDKITTLAHIRGVALG